MFTKKKLNQRYISVESSSAFMDFTDRLYYHIDKGVRDGYKTFVFVCIGTDRSTGDSLGPLVGYKIGKLNYDNVFIYGTLDDPVHAKNIDEKMRDIYMKYDRPFIVAIDACLGRMDHVGYINIAEGPLKPGAGVNKELDPVGDISITGIVNFGGFMDFLVLQNTRLSIVMKMADIIAVGIRYVLWKINKDPYMSSILYGLKA